MKKIYILITVIFIFLHTSEIPAQLKTDPAGLMNRFYFKNSFGRISNKQVYPSVSYVPIYINNFSNYDLIDSSTNNDFGSYCVFPKIIRSNESQMGMLFYSFKLANDSKKGQMSVLYYFNDAYRTPFVFRLLTQDLTPPPTSQRNGLGKLLKGIGSFFSIVGKLLPDGVGAVINFLFQAAAFFVTLPPDYYETEWANYYSLAYVYASGGDMNTPEVVYYADTTGTPSSNASYMYWDHEISDTAFVIENAVVYFNQLTNYPSGNTPGYISPAHIVNIYNRWEFNASHIKATAEWIRDYKKDYEKHSDMKKLIEHLAGSSVNNIAEFYTGEYNCRNSSETLKFLEDYYNNKIGHNSSEYESLLKKTIKIHKLL